MLKTLFALVLLTAQITPVHAAPREAGKGDNGAVLKLQAMVKSLTTEKEAAKAETAKVSAELDTLKKESSASAKAADAAKQQLDSELSEQKNSNTQVRERLDQTNARLLEVIEKYKVLNQNKGAVENELAELKNKQQVTEQKLASCTEHNVKLYESGKELLERYQNKGTISSLLQDEPALQFNSVEMESIIQEYEDKLRSGEYKGK
jgi:chromosome segregation ATPase